MLSFCVCVCVCGCPGCCICDGVRLICDALCCANRTDALSCEDSCWTTHVWCRKLQPVARPTWEPDGSVTKCGHCDTKLGGASGWTFIAPNGSRFIATDPTVLVPSRLGCVASSVVFCCMALSQMPIWERASIGTAEVTVGAGQKGDGRSGNDGIGLGGCVSLALQVVRCVSHVCVHVYACRMSRMAAGCKFHFACLPFVASRVLHVASCCGCCRPIGVGVRRVC
jgi:hypothetical protein